MRITLLTLMLLLINTTAFGCGSFSVDNDDEILVRDSQIVDYILEDISVAVGTTVVWTNMDLNVHTITSGVPPKSGMWGSSFLKENDKFSFEFSEVGEFHYWCRVHPFMKATVKVVN